MFIRNREGLVVKGLVPLWYGLFSYTLRLMWAEFDFGTYFFSEPFSLRVLPKLLGFLSPKRTSSIPITRCRIISLMCLFQILVYFLRMITSCSVLMFVSQAKGTIFGRYSYKPARPSRRITRQPVKKTAKFLGFFSHVTIYLAENVSFRLNIAFYICISFVTINFYRVFLVW